MEFRTFGEGEKRLPTWAEREPWRTSRRPGLRTFTGNSPRRHKDSGKASFNLVDWSVQSVGSDSATWKTWAREFRWAQDLGEFRESPPETFSNLVRKAFLFNQGQDTKRAPASLRLSAVEHLLDVADPEPEFYDQVNNRARWFRVGIKLEGTRFVPLTSEFLHEHIVRPALLLLADDQLSAVDSLNRKAFDRALSNDPAGAITAANSAVEEMLRVGTGVKKSTLDKLAAQARKDRWISPAVHQLIVKLAALREESDAHTLGTDETEVAMFTLNLSGSILVHLGRTLPSVLENQTDS